MSLRERIARMFGVVSEGEAASSVSQAFGRGVTAGLQSQEHLVRAVGDTLSRVLAEHREATKPVPDPPAPEPAPEPPFIDATCCGRSDFVMVNPTRSFRFNGARTTDKVTGALLTCTHCGRIHAVNETGLYEPHMGALPMNRAVEALRQRVAPDTDRPRPVPKNPTREFRRPKG